MLKRALSSRFTTVEFAKSATLMPAWRRLGELCDANPGEIARAMVDSRESFARENMLGFVVFGERSYTKRQASVHRKERRGKGEWDTGEYNNGQQGPWGLRRESNAADGELAHKLGEQLTNDGPVRGPKWDTHHAITGLACVRHVAVPSTSTIRVTKTYNATLVVFALKFSNWYAEGAACCSFK